MALVAAGDAALALGDRVLVQYPRYATHHEHIALAEGMHGERSILMPDGDIYP
jgi:hypothetical protein